MAFGCGKRVIVTPAVYSRFIEYINYNIFSALDRIHIASITLRFCTILWFKANSRIPMARTCSLLAVYQIYINPWYAKNFQNRLVFFNLMILFCFIKKKSVYYTRFCDFIPCFYVLFVVNEIAKCRLRVHLLTLDLLVLATMKNAAKCEIVLRIAKLSESFILLM